MNIGRNLNTNSIQLNISEREIALVAERLPDIIADRIAREFLNRNADKLFEDKKFMASIKKLGIAAASERLAKYVSDKLMNDMERREGKQNGN